MRGLRPHPRGDLVESYKILSGKTNYGEGMYKVSRSGLKLLYSSKDGFYKFNFLTNRAVNYWKRIPSIVKEALTTANFKTRLENYKQMNYDTPGNFWELSAEVLLRIQDQDRESYVSFMKDNPDVAARRGVSVTFES